MLATHIVFLGYIRNSANAYYRKLKPARYRQAFEKIILNFPLLKIDNEWIGDADE